MQRKLVLLFVFLLFIAVVAIFRPVPIVKEEKALTVSGVVEKIKLTKGNDFVFKLKNNPTKYYINRGIEVGLNYKEFENKILNQFVEVKYPKYWTPLDWNNTVRHISKISLGQKVLFNELK